MLDSGNITDVGANEFPMYTDDSTVPPTGRTKIAVDAIYNANSLSNYKLSPASAPAPNTLVPVGSDGKFSASVIPAVPATTIYSRDGLHTYTLVVESNGALSVDPA